MIIPVVSGGDYLANHSSREFRFSSRCEAWAARLGMVVGEAMLLHQKAVKHSAIQEVGAA